MHRTPSIPAATVMMMRMSCCVVVDFSFFLFLLLLSSAMARTPDLVADTCKKIASSDANVDRAFCVNSLRHNAAAAAARDLRGLAVAATRLAAANATLAEAAATAALKKGPAEEGGPRRLSLYERSCLEACQELFDGAASELTEAADMIAADSLHDEGAVNVRLSTGVDAPLTCEDGFDEGGLASPLAKEDAALFQLAVVALAITTSLH